MVVVVVVVVMVVADLKQQTSLADVRATPPERSPSMTTARERKNRAELGDRARGPRAYSPA